MRGGGSQSVSPLVTAPSCAVSVVRIDNVGYSTLYFHHVTVPFTDPLQ
jgi:hypothetical protein